MIGKAHEPSETQLGELESSYLNTATHLCEQSHFKGLLEEVHSHGSRQLGTIIRPRDGTREGFDIDLIARFSASAMDVYRGPNGPTLLLDQLEQSIGIYTDAHSLRKKRWERCITIYYAGGMTADIAPVVDSPLHAAAYGSTHGLVPDNEAQKFEPTNPRGYAKFFKEAGDISPVYQREFVKAMESITDAVIEPLPEASETLARLLCRFVQLVKLHRNIMFGIPAAGQKDLAPSSVFLTTLIAQSYKIEAPIPHASPLALLLDIVRGMPQRFQVVQTGGVPRWVLPNPAVPNGNLAEDMRTKARQDAFVLWHGKLMTDLETILQTIEFNTGLDKLCDAVENAFGPRAAKAITQDQANQQETRRGQGKTAIYGSLVAGFSGAVSAAASQPRLIVSRPHTFFGS